MPFPAISPNRLSLFVSISLCLMTGACATVEPWERGRLAKPQMAAERSALQSAVRSHTYGSREAGSASGEVSGGGCGCY